MDNTTDANTAPTTWDFSNVTITVQPWLELATAGTETEGADRCAS